MLESPRGVKGGNALPGVKGVGDPPGGGRGLETPWVGGVRGGGDPPGGWGGMGGEGKPENPGGSKK